MPQTYVFDTSAWFALLEDEDGADVVEGLLREAAKGEAQVLTSFMSFMEVAYITLHERGAREADERVRLIGMTASARVESNVRLAALAARFKASCQMSVADAWIAALTQDRAATLVHKDPEYEQVEDTIDTLRLPYK